MKHRTVVALAVLMAGTILFGAVAQEAPRVLQADEAGYSTTEQAALDRAIRELERLLADWTLGSRRRLGEGGWGAADFAAYAAGSLERYGYRTVIVRRDDPSAGVRVWVLVALDLGSATAWVPVDPLPAPSRQQTTLGTVAREGTGASPLRFDGRYVAYDAIVELPPNAPPIAVIGPVGTVEQGESTAWFGHASTDPDGEILLYWWSFDEEPVGPASAPSAWHTFAAAGRHTVELTVTDSRGAQASTVLVIDAVVPSEDCGCGGGG